MMLDIETNLGAVYQQVRNIFRDANLETPELDAKWILAFVFGVAPNDVLLKPETPVTPNNALQSAILRRLAREPVSRITGFRGFYGLEFKVDENVLDPRADTETLVDAARKYLEGIGKRDAHILDLGTGSGCIPLALLSVFPDARALAVDVSDGAVATAKRNAKRLGFDNRIDFVQSNWTDAVTGTFDIITMNPPYIPSWCIDELSPDVRLYDPAVALNGGADGLDPYRIIFPQIRRLLVDGGMVFAETGVGLAGDVCRLGEDAGFKVSGVVNDLGGIARVVCMVHNA